MRTFKFTAVFLLVGIFCALLSPPVYADADRIVSAPDGGMAAERLNEDRKPNELSSETASEEDYVPGDIIVVLKQDYSAKSGISAADGDKYLLPKHLVRYLASRASNGKYGTHCPKYGFPPMSRL